MLSQANEQVSAATDLIKFRWSVDHSAINEDGALLIFGWALHDAQAIAALRVMLKFRDGSQQKFQVVYGTERTDVAQSVKDNPRALSSGYYFFGQAQRTDVMALSLEVQLANGELSTLPTNSTIAVPPLDAAQGAGAQRAAVYRHLAVRSLQFIRSGRFLDLVSVARRYLRGKPQQATDSIGRVRGMAADASSAQLIVDHDLGGGANHVRHTLVKELLGTGTVVFILTFHVPTLQYVLECRRRKESMRFTVNLYEFLQALPDLNLRRVHWNNAVSFTRQVALLDALTALVRRAAVPVTYYLHDYHSVCPSHFLLDKDGEYCGVPNIEQCLKCLPEMKDGLVSLFAERDIHLWRRRWDAFLSAADEIVYFSQASLALLIRAYPQLARHPGLKFQPHDISDFMSQPLSFDLRAPLNIGVVGRINAHKGARVVEQMAAAIDESGADAHITVLGALDGPGRSRTVTITGSYKRDALVSLIAKHKVNVIAFTSIWPETFSFVVAEVMSLGLPIVCFDLGAPAERVKDYSLGRVVPLSDGKKLLEAAAALREDLLNAAKKPVVKPIAVVRKNALPISIDNED
ncbi:glycosyltransferase [Burkholderia vietnamiensis]|uniref:glycosyltransferase n=1 Tax=Burkholderia vietnamiensis TaxID=60552 RepID=UPI001594A736|nr:glycosyltransferase [Burkholderia vietnamiensis]